MNPIKICQKSIGNTQCTISSLKALLRMQKPVFSSKIPALLILVLPEGKEKKKRWTGT